MAYNQGAPSWNQQPPYGQAPHGGSPYPPVHGGHAPPQQQPYGQAPFQGYPSQGYGQPAPLAHSPYPPQGGYAPPPHAGAPSPYAGAPIQPYAGPPAPASLGYDPRVVPQANMNAPAEALRDAMKGFGTNEAKLIQTLAAVPDAPHMLKLRHTYDDRFRRSLTSDLESETSGYFKMALVALSRGPLLQDAAQVDRAIAGLGTKETLLDDVILGRSNADLMAIKQCYSQVYKKDMTKEIREDLSLKTARLFEYVLEARRAEESAPVLPNEVEHNVDRIQQATEGTKIGSNQDVVSHVMAYSSNGMIRAINSRYQAKYRKSLDEQFKKSFSGHMKDALRLMVARAADPIKSDADQLEDSMRGMGTKDEQLVTRLVRAHWDRNHFNQVKIAYAKFHGKQLSARIHGETSGDYRKLLEALCV